MPNVDRGHGAAASAGRSRVVVPLAALRQSAVDLCGGKAANLGELIGAGFPVPDGFCITTLAYAKAADEARLAPVVAAIADTPPTAVDALEKLAAKARLTLLDAPVPGSLAGACAEAYRALGAGAHVAVRSSATAEDLPDASFAGQQDTFLHVVGEAAVLDAIRRCWASLWTDRAVVYRAKNHIDPRSVRLAVVVQRMVESAVAGVLFTADPVTGKRGRAVIDAAPGLGEAVVSGAVNPDHFEVDSRSSVIESRRPGDKRVRIVPVPEGGTRRELGPDRSAEACLSDAEILDLARLGSRVEAHYGAPQDIEWALDAGRAIWLVQSRPITTLFPLPGGERAAEGPAKLYLNFNVAQGVFQPFTPMGRQMWRVITAGISARAGFPYDDPERGPEALQVAGARLFVDLTDFVTTDLGRRALSFAFPRMEARSAEMLETLFEDPRFAEVPASRWTLLRRLGRAFARTRLPLTLLRYWASPYDAASLCRAAGDRALSLGDVPEGATPEEKLAAARRVLEEGPGVMIPVIVPAFVGGMLAWVLSKKLLEGIATPAEMETTFRALRHNPTTEMDLALWGLAVRLRDDPESLSVLRSIAPSELSARCLRGTLPLALQRGAEEFLERYGARGVAEIDIGVPRWRDDPTHILGALANYVAHPESAVAPDEQFARVEREAESMVESLVERARERDPLRADLARFALSRMRELAGLREAPKFYAVRLIGRARKLLVDVGRSLVARGRLDDAEDVFMLDLGEVRSALEGADVRPLLGPRRAEMAREASRKNLPRLLISDGTEPVPARARSSSPDRLTGTPASTGRVTAPARVILDPNGARLERGEILVAPSTDPGWTPLFLTAGGLVMEMGGAMSHGAVVAREYGIPAVVGVPGATERIETGDLLTVDGAAGTVDLPKQAE